ncbi:hypothetical protein BV898_10943 [Hypsibius exemplaris]|uniref:arylamine N-acetyltransferase n=1 Tax=Hypsibius exemplaris TaxID=2072580 RepID=A0A1W0WIB4_HYPEX|nr:hypothetical protein BV898_10943 [Hypsibius exemplaris]
MAPNMLTKAEALHYITSSLRLALNPAEQDVPSLSKLHKICQAFIAEVPYSTLAIINTPMKQRRVPTLEEIKQQGLTKQGGMCYEMNVFLHWLLLAMGYEVHLLMARSFSVDYTHPLNTVRLDGKYYMVDCGPFPCMTEHLICLDFAGDESPVILQSIWEVQLRRRLIDGVPGFAGYFRWTPNSSFPLGRHHTLPLDKDGWALFFEYAFVFRSLEQIQQMSVAIQSSYQDVTVSPVLNRIFCCRYPKGRLQLVRNTTLWQENEPRIRSIKDTKSKAELVETLVEQFGDVLDRGLIEGAVEYYVTVAKLPEDFVLH